jgi:hypothetical protein
MVLKIFRDVAIWSTIELGLGIAATAACALRPLFKKFFDLSTSATVKSRGNTHTSAHFGNRNGGTGAMGTNDDVEMALGGGKTKVTGSTSKPQDKYRREKGVRILGRSKSNTSSEEDLTGKGGIQVHKTVEIRREIDKEEDSGSSTKSSPLTPWQGP